MEVQITSSVNRDAVSPTHLCEDSNSFDLLMKTGLKLTGFTYGYKFLCCQLVWVAVMNDSCYE